MKSIWPSFGPSQLDQGFLEVQQLSAPPPRQYRLMHSEPVWIDRLHLSHSRRRHGLEESVDAKNILFNQAHNVGLPGPGPPVREMS